MKLDFQHTNVMPIQLLCAFVLDNAVKIKHDKETCYCY